MQARYARNAASITVSETQSLHQKSVCIVGLGGLGGYVCELLSRVGVGTITGFDDDVITASNLNRQLFATEAGVGRRKADEAKARIAAVNSETAFTARAERVTAENAEILLAGCDAVVDCCDNIQTRLVLERAAEALGIPLIHGAIGGWYGQVGVCMPGDRLITKLYGGYTGQGVEQALGNPSFTPALIAAAEASETVKVLLNKGTPLRGRLLHIDLLNMETQFTAFPDASV